MKIALKKFVYPHPVHCHRDMYCDSIGSGENYDGASPQVGAAIAAAMVDGEGVLDYFGKHRWMKAVGKRLLSRVRTKVTLRLVMLLSFICAAIQIQIHPMKMKKKMCEMRFVGRAGCTPPGRAT